ncbi:uncharacterized protein ACJ7VT_000953, partial [Polymixia lowei]
MAASGGGLSSPANVAGSNNPAPARARFPGRPGAARSRLRFEKRPQVGRLGSGGGEIVTGRPRPINIGLTLSEDPSLLRLLGVAEKRRRQKDVGFESSGSEEDEDFTGFGTTQICSQLIPGSPPQSLPSQEKPPPAPDLSGGAKPLIGKIVPRNPKSALIGKIVKRVPKEDQGMKGSPAKDTPVPRITIKLPAKQIAPKAKFAGRQASGAQSSTKSKVDATSATSTGSKQDQTAKDSTSAGGTKQDKLVCTLTVVKGKDKASRVKKLGSVSEDSEADQAKPRRHVKSVKGSHHKDIKGACGASQGVALSPKLFNKQQRRRAAKDMADSPEAGTEARAQSGQEAA